MMCRDIHCAEHRYLESFECVIKQGQTVSKCYQLFVKLNVSQGQIYATLFNGITNMLLTVQRVLDMVPLDFTSLRKFTIYKKNLENDNFRLIDYVVAELLVETRGTPESDTEVKIYQNLHGNSFIMDGVTYDTELDTYVTEFVTHKAFPEPIEMLRIPHSNLSLSELLPPVYSESFPADNDGENLCSGNMSSPYYKIRFCPYLEIDLGEWNIEIENGTLRLEKEFTTQSFTKWEYAITENGLIICLEDFQSIYASLPSRETVKPSTNDTISTKRILAFICSILSLVSLLITIVVYLLLPKLQSQPGINNVILCICLFLAQSLYQFGAGQTSLSYWECSLIGAFSHFFWLSAMFSMNSCSVQMFLIFKSSVKVTPKFRMKHTLKYVSYVVFASLACVVINVTVSVIKSGGQESGYGGNICYISSYIMNVVTFIIPTGCTVIANIVLFAYVIFKIEKSNVSSTKMNVERNYFGVYARLSTLTGLTWIFGFILLFVESEVCEYLFIIFNASQGLLIMIAFIFNHRVFSLCCGEKGLIRTSIGMMSSKKSRSSGSMVDRSAANRSDMSEPEPQPSTSYAYYSSS